MNDPFHYVDGNELNQLLEKLVDQKLLSTGNFISRSRAQSTCSFMKNPIPDDPHECKHFIRQLERYKINLNEYKSLLARSVLPNRCILLPDAINLLTSSSKHLEDCIKYGLQSKGR